MVFSFGKKCKGLSLLEVMIALVIFAVAFSPLFVMLTSSKKGIKQGETYFTGVLLAEKAMEELSSFIWFSPNLPIPATRNYNAFPKYKVRIKRKPVENELFELQVRVNWKEDDGTKEVEISRLYSSRALRTYDERFEYPWDKK